MFVATDWVFFQAKTWVFFKTKSTPSHFATATLQLVTCRDVSQRQPIIQLLWRLGVRRAQHPQHTDDNLVSAELGVPPVQLN